MKQTKYGILCLKTNNLLKWESRDCGDDCGDMSGSTFHELTNDVDGSLWLVNTPEEAEYVRNFSTVYYNSDYLSPEHDFDPEQLQTVAIEMNTSTVVVKIPDFEDFMNMRISQAEDSANQTGEVANYKELIKDFKKAKKTLSLGQLNKRFNMFYHDWVPLNRAKNKVS